MPFFDDKDKLMGVQEFYTDKLNDFNSSVFR